MQSSPVEVAVIDLPQRIVRKSAIFRVQSAGDMGTRLQPCNQYEISVEIYNWKPRPRWGSDMKIKSLGGVNN